MADVGAIARGLAFTSVVKLAGEYGPVKARASGLAKYSLPTKFYTLPVALGDNNGAISGQVSELGSGAVAKCLVRLYYRLTGYLVAQQYTTTGGLYSFTGLDSTDLNNYYVIALDPDGGTQYNIASLDRMTAKAPAFTQRVAPQPFDLVTAGVPSINDPNFSNVLLLLHGDGVSGSLVFTDSSSYARSMGSTGVALGVSSEPVLPKFGTNKFTFAAQGNRMNVTSADFALGTADFTIEFWVAPSTSSNSAAYCRFIEIGPNSTGGGLWITRDNLTSPYNILVQVHDGSGYVTVGQTTVGAPVGVWTHIAVTRASGVWRTFVNGMLAATVSYTGTGNSITQTALYIGANNSTGEGFVGFIDDLRITKNAARYNNLLAVPTSAYPNSAPADTYFANTVLLLHCDGSNGSTTFTDSSAAAKTVTANGNAAVSTAQAKFGGASAAFDGSGDWLQTTSSLSDFCFGTGNFTIEAWVYTSSGNRCILDFYGSSVVNSWQLFVDANGLLTWYSNNGSGAVTVASAVSGDLRTSTWRHVAVCRYGTTLALFVDGAPVAVVQDTRNYNPTAITQLSIGAQVFSRNATYDWNGYIDDVRITKGVARYTANFALPTGPFSNN